MDEEFKNTKHIDDRKLLILQKTTLPMFKKETSFDLSSEIRQKCNTIILKQAPGAKKRAKRISMNFHQQKSHDITRNNKCTINLL